MMCSFCGAKGVKLDAINYGGKMVMRCITCKVLDGVKADSTQAICKECEGDGCTKCTIFCGDCLTPIENCGCRP